MKNLNCLGKPLVYILKILTWFVLITNFNLVNASVVTVKVEEAGVFNWDPMQKVAPGFGSSGPVSLNWDPFNDLFTELLAYDRGYSGGAAVFCWYGENCALQLTVTAENTALNLQSFDLSYYGFGNNVQYNVIDMANQASVLADSPWVDGRVSSLIDVNLTSNTGFLILFGPDGFNGGINNIVYSYNSTAEQAPVHTPIPATVWLFGFGLAGLMSFARQSRAV